MAVEGFVNNISSMASEQTENILKNTFGILGGIPGFDFLIRIFQVVGALIILYIIFYIMQVFAGWKSAKMLKVIAKNVEEINSKMNILIGKSKAKRK